MYGIVDIGSNTIRLSVYKKTDSSFKLMFHRKTAAGLAGYLNKHGALSEKGIQRAIRVLRGFSQLLNNIEVREVYAFATASLRNVTNTDYAVSVISSESGFPIEVVSGEQEAIYDFVGATCFMPLDKGVLVDIGGGSTELALFADGKIEQALSLPIGSLNLYTEFVDDLLPNKKELDNIKSHIKVHLKDIPIPTDCPIICGVGGTIRNACKLNNAIYHNPLDNRQMGIHNMRDILQDFHNDRSYAIKKILQIAPDRIHTIIPGMTILDMVAKKYGSTSLTVSEYGIREGYLYTKLFAEKENDGNLCDEG